MHLLSNNGHSVPSKVHPTSALGIIRISISIRRRAPVVYS